MRRTTIVGLSALACACGSGSGGGSTLSSFCASVNAALVKAAVTCLHANQAYVAALNLEFQGIDCTDLQKAADAGRLTFDPKSAQACLVAATNCDSFDPEATTPAPCLAALHGNVPVGGTCYQSTDCQAGSFCDTSVDNCPGSCVAYATVGGDCSATLCDPSLWCDANTNTCVARASAGTACDPLPCQIGLYCSGSGSSLCAARLTSGSCDPTLDQCAPGYACTGSGPACMSLVGAGGNCSADPSTLCGPGFTCGTDDRCASLPTVGSACTAGQACVAGYCDSTGRCTAWKRKGDSCSSDAECVTLSCPAGTCVSDAPCSPP
ncbi:MAG TPA: hypothetical protein VMT17_05385 [Anaeromyxobacteraceae bacterium]|nr:hypothetical protein [Anaeromyxobacteraceae bacterium]